MKQFDTVFRGYDKTQVAKALDEIINNYEALLIKSKATEEDNKRLSEKMAYYEGLENTLNRAIFNAEKSGDDIRRVARREAEVLVDEARRNSNRIINDALIKAEKAQTQADLLKRNTKMLKRRLAQIIENQMEVINEIDEIDFSKYEVNE